VEGVEEGAGMKTVENGAALLDERLPGWANEIDAEELDLERSCNCVLGQLFGSYDKGRRVLGLSHSEAKRFGFFRWPTSRWGSLNFEWRWLIRDRQS
jgi:hypothetical protein